MLQRVTDRRPSYNNNIRITSSTSVSTLKYYYYQLFALLYSFTGKAASIIMVNSTWTLNHIVSIWGQTCHIVKVYPPCNTTHLLNLPLEGRKRIILSIGQFRPEKDHVLQLMYVVVLKHTVRHVPQHHIFVTISCDHLFHILYYDIFIGHFNDC